MTPIQLAASTLPLVNGGIAVAPTFLPRSREDGMAGGSRVLKSETSSAMLKLMRLNVLKGTGKRANADGYRVGGKTGTAEKVVGGHYSDLDLLTSFLSTFPTDAPEYLVLVMLDEPQRVAEIEQPGDRRRQRRSHRRQDHRAHRPHSRRRAAARGRTAQI